MRRVVFMFLIISVFFSCGKEKQVNTLNNAPTINISASLKFAGNKKKIQRGDSVTVIFKSNQEADSVRLYLHDSLLVTKKDVKEFRYVWQSPDDLKLGRKVFKANVYKDGQYISTMANIIVLSDREPAKLGYKIRKVYPHDRHAYTQGLVYQDNILYEATGLKGESSLRKVKLETGEIIQSYTIPPDYFGEGITIYGNKLIQLTWQSHTGFVYDKNTFQKLAEFNYPTEGWGLTTDGKYLIMSDGTNILTFLDPNTYVPVKTLEVYDDKKARTLLNELEYINGKIYANVYTKDFIAVINPRDGAVEAYIDMSGLLKPQDKDRNTDVLNGIAYDKAKKRIFVTGKNWPKLFWVEFTGKNH